MNDLLAQSIKIPGLTGTLSGPLNKPGKVQFKTLSDLVNNAQTIMFALAGILLLAYLIWGGFDFLTSMGDPKKAEAGKTKITQAVIGFFIIFAAYWIVQVVAFVFGLKDSGF